MGAGTVTLAPSAVKNVQPETAPDKLTYERGAYPLMKLAVRASGVLISFPPQRRSAAFWRTDGTFRISS